MPKKTLKEYALHRQITCRSVYRYIDEKVIPPGAVSRDGRKILIDRAKADRALNRHVTTRKQLLQKASPADRDMEKKAKTARKAGTSNLSFHEARTFAQRFKAGLLKLDLDERTGKLVDAEQVKATAFTLARTVRDALLNIPDRIAPVLAAERSESKITEILTREIRRALEGIEPLKKGGPHVECRIDVL